MKKKDKSYTEIKDNFEFYGRYDFYSNLITSLRESEGHLSIAINGVWGSGKTILASKLVDDLNGYNDICGNYFNAWESDYFETPIYAIINNLLSDDEFLQVFENSIDRNQQVKLNLGFSLSGITIRPTFEDKYEETLKAIKFNNFTLTFIRDLLINYLKTKNKKLIFIIDELDRCKPNFAISLLEQLKNVNIDGLVFLYFTDIEQLGNSIISNYSANYNVSNYLYKFFDEIITLPDLKYEKFFEYFAYTCPELKKFEFREDAIYDSALTFKFAYRDINRISIFLQKIRRYNSRIRTMSQYIRVLEDTTLVMFCIMRIKYPNLFREVLSSNSISEELILKLTLIKSYMNLFDEVFAKEPTMSNTNINKFLLDLLSNEIIKVSLR